MWKFNHPQFSSKSTDLTIKGALYMFPEYARGAIEKAEIIPYSNFMNLNVPDQDNACEGR